MMQNALQRWLLTLVSTILIACGGDENITDFTEVSDLRLDSLSVVEGGTLLQDENPVEEFDPDNIGPYRIDLDEQSQDSVSVQMSLTQTEDAKIEVVEIGKEEDGTSRITEINSGDTVSLEVAEGINVVFIRVSSLTSAARADYTVTINRASSSSALGNVVISGIRPTTESEGVTIDRDVEEDIFEYNVTLASGICSASFVPEPENRQAQIVINGEARDWREVVNISLQEDVTTPVVVELTSEDGSSNQQYTFNLTREVSDAEAIASDARLRSLEIVEGRSTSAFICSVSEIVQRLSVEDTALTLTAVAERDGTEMTIGNALLDENGLTQVDENGLFLSENDEPLVSGETYTGSLLSDLPTDVSAFIIRSTAPDGETQVAYRLTVSRTENTEVFVTSAQELQQAMRNATPDTEIIVAEGDYLGVVGEGDEQSGHPSAHFYSSASGDADNPITLRAESGALVQLMGDDTAQNDVLRIEGDYWRVISLDISGAQNGVVLDGADNVTLDSLDIEEVGERGIVLINSSSNNQVVAGTIDRTGQMPQTREGVEEVYGEAIVIGDGEGISDGNSVRNVLFGLNVANEYIDIKPNSDNAVAQFNTFDLDNTIVRPFDDRSVIRVSGGSSEVSYNVFDFNFISSGTDAISQFVDVESAEGTTSEIYQNAFLVDGQSIALVNGTSAGSVRVADNTVDMGEVLYTGNVDQSFATPEFQIRSTLDETQCLAREDLTITVGEESVTIDGVIAKACADETSQKWVFLHDGEGFVQIAQASDIAAKMRFFNLSAVVQDLNVAVLAIREDADSNFDSSFFLRWLVLFNGDDAAILNRASPISFIAEDDDFSIEGVEFSDQPVFVTIPISELSSQFRLIRQ